MSQIFFPSFHLSFDFFLVSFLCSPAYSCMFYLWHLNFESESFSLYPRYKGIHQYFLWVLVEGFFYCFSITVVPIFPLALPCPPPHSHSQSPPCCPCPWLLYTCFLTRPFPFFLLLSPCPSLLVPVCTFGFLIHVQFIMYGLRKRSNFFFLPTLITVKFIFASVIWDATFITYYNSLYTWVYSWTFVFIPLVCLFICHWWSVNDWGVVARFNIM